MLREGTHSSCVIEDEYEVRELEADLPAEAGAAGSYGGGSTPGAICQTRDYYAVTVAGRAEETGFDYR